MTACYLFKMLNFPHFRPHAGSFLTKIEKQRQLYNCHCLDRCSLSGQAPVIHHLYCMADLAQSAGESSNPAHMNPWEFSFLLHNSFDIQISPWEQIFQEG